MFRAALIILAKDTRLRVRDRSVWIFAFAVPLALIFVFSSLLPDEGDFHFEAGLVQADQGDLATAFATGVVPALEAEGFATVTRFDDEHAARDAIGEGTIAAAWVFEDGFSEGVLTQGQGTVGVLVDPEQGLAAQLARGVAESFRAQIARSARSVATGQHATQGGLDQAAIDEIVAASSADRLVGFEELIEEDRQLDPSSYFAAGMAIFFLFFTVTFGITGTLEEREQGTLTRLRAAPIPGISLHLGKALGVFILGNVSMVVLAMASAWLLNAPWGPPAGLAVLIPAAVIAGLGVMALVGSFARTAEQAGNLQSIVALVLGLAGGVFFPVGAGFLGTLSQVSPHGWFLRGLADLAGEGTVVSVLPAAAALIAFGVVTAIPGVWRMAREVAQ